MNTNLTYGTYPVPTAYVSKNRLRLKQYNDTVFLNNGDEFEIELFNPTSNKFLAKIELNGKSIGSGVVLRPGERVFLERYLDEAKKFLFETYNVEGNDEAIKKAIADNGNLRVRFFKEEIPVANFYPTVTWTTHTFPVWNGEYTCYDTTAGRTTSGGGIVNNTTTNMYNASSTLTAGGASASGTISTNSLSRSMDTLDFAPQSRSMSKSKSIRQESVETGRIEKGSHSNQNFVMDSSSFQYYHSYESKWKILPVSQKVLVKEDLKVYCTECGARRKKESFKFCPNCGGKF